MTFVQKENRLHENSEIHGQQQQQKGFQEMQEKRTSWSTFGLNVQTF
jgi:hypothetical protein